MIVSYMAAKDGSLCSTKDMRTRDNAEDDGILSEKSKRGDQKMQIFRRVVKSMILTVLTAAIISGFSLADCQSVFAQGESETVIGKVYQFGEKGSYNLSSAEQSAYTDTGTETDGKFSVSGNISSVTKKNGVPAYAVNGGTLTFSYEYEDDLLNASEDEVHLVNDDSKKVYETTLASEIRKGALIVQTQRMVRSGMTCSVQHRRIYSKIIRMG